MNKVKKIEKLKRFRRIVRDYTALEIDGIEVDIFDAAAVLSAHGCLSKEDQDRFLDEPARVMIWKAWNLLGKERGWKR
ncbi:hypothetical protein [Salinithrix halophila]|uniref:Uncharacterized protein n=1 Tax=Salinithrix halophila TaxID=1485204 RepID=A0ABV8J8N6_9BACL